jgi:hypothetical protein
VGGAQILAGVILPIICLAISYPSRPPWQSGTVDAYAKLLLAHRASSPLYPFLGYSMISMVLLFADPARFRRNVLVRFGIFSGVLLAAEYWLIFQAAMGGWGLILPAIVSLLGACILGGLLWGIARFLGLMLKEHPECSAGGLVALLLVAAIAIGMIVNGSMIFVFAFLWCSTPWALAAYVVASFRLIRGGEARFRFSLAQLLGFVSWFAAYCGAWRLSFICMLDEYSRLPTTAPSECFVCTAAAGGHRRVVGSELYFAPNGTAYRVNDQLRVLKAFELLLAGISPRSHRACRWIYDRLGPRLAAMLVHPALADVGYFALKPVEWIALVGLRLATGGKMEVIFSLYSTEPPNRAPQAGAPAHQLPRPVESNLEGAQRTSTSVPPAAGRCD